MDTSTSSARDSRFNMGYNMSLLSGESSPEMYGSADAGGNRASTSLNPSMSRTGMSLSNSCGAGLQRGLKRTSSDVCFDQVVSGGRSTMGMPSDCGSDLLDDGFVQSPQKSTPPPNGKKTKGRVKIKMEYIDNKLRRYTTFSKRKTGIMKKAYELSTLTGTQVMLLVASETGHVYTFATRKLQPMITSEAGKALIQTCLNSPDPCPSGGGSGGDQRMSAQGFEETELSYNIGDEDQKDYDDPLSPRSADDAEQDNNGDLSGAESASGPDSPGRAASPPSPAPPAHVQPALRLPDVIRGFQKALQEGSGSGSSSVESASPSEAHSSSSGATSLATSLATSGSSLLSASYPTGLMYHTAQGLVYATPTPALSNGVILNLGTGSLQLHPHPHSDGNGNNAAAAAAAAAAILRPQQFIRIPFPIPLTDPSVNTNGIQEAADLSKNRK